MFTFLNRLAVSPDQDVADLLTGAVFPELAEYGITADLAERMLVGKGRQAFEDAVALWGPPRPEAPRTTGSSLIGDLAILMPGLHLGVDADSLKIGAAIGKRVTSEIERGTADENLAGLFDVLNRMATSPDWSVEAAFHHAVAELTASRPAGVVEAAQRLLTGQALKALEDRIR